MSARAAALPRPSRVRVGSLRWEDTPVSQRSRFGDDVWHLDIRVAGRSPSANHLRWDVPLPDGSRLADACFVVIAGFVGMRVSEILSMQVGAVEHHPIGETGVAQAYIVARLFKTTDEPDGRVERWLAPAPVVRAVECLERIYAPLRAASGMTSCSWPKVACPTRSRG